jgi:hypothetical protein
MRTTVIIAMLLVSMLFAAAPTVIGNETDGKPMLTHNPIEVEPGDTFDLELSVQAWVNSSYTVTFAERTRFSFPGARAQTQVMTTGDAILFKVQCEVESDAPDGDFPVAFKVTWDDNGTAEEMDGEVMVVVGEGAGTTDSFCTSSIMIVAPAIIAFSLLIVRQRGGRRD